MATAISSSSSISGRPTYSCVRCASRKVKCDRQKPCSACIKHQVDCVFNISQPPPKRHKRAKDHILADRLRQYEVLLKEQGIDPSKLPDASNSEPHRASTHGVAVVPTEPQFQTPSSIESEPTGAANKTQVVHSQGRFKFVDNSLWTRVVEEFHDREDALGCSSADASDQEASDDDFGYVLSSQPKLNTRSRRHPPPELIHQLWQIFIENIDPLTKVLHVPTLRPAVQKAASSTETMPRSFEPLMFAIYAVAVMSLKDEECQQRLCEPRKTLLSRYISATKAALSRAKFMGTTSLVVLQALILHIISVRDIYEPRAVWSLTGVAVRIAQNMGLERDGVALGLPPFETEIRRRVWWLLKTHDFRTAELCGLTKFRDIDTSPESTKWPANVNDDQLFPGMTSLADTTNTVTDNVFLSLKYELAKLAANKVAKFRLQGKSPSQWELHASENGNKAEIDEGITEIEEALETKYIRYCDPSQPLHLMAMLVGRLSINVVRFLTHHPRRWASIEQTPLSERQKVWEISLQLLEQHNMALSNPQLKQFAWHAAYFQQWHAFIHVLDTLRANPLAVDAARAWQLIGSIYDHTSDMVLNQRKPIYVAVGNLCLKAYGDREAALQNGSMPPLPTLDFIMQLRQQREIAKAKKQARDAKSSQPEYQLRREQPNSYDAGLMPDDSAVHLSDTLQSTHLRQLKTSHPSTLAQTGGNIEEDPYWFINEIDELDDVMNVDSNFMMVQDHNLDDNATQTIDWEQWDAWLADSNLMRPQL